VIVGSLPSGGSGEQFRGTLLEFAAWDRSLVRPDALHRLLDNISVQAKPAL